MTQRRSKPLAAPPPPEEASPFNAKDAFRQGEGHEPILGQYTRDLAEALTLIANLLDPKGRPKRGLRLKFVDQDDRSLSAKKKRASRAIDEDWEGNFLQLQEAIERRSAIAIGWYLRDGAEVLSLLGARLDPPAKHKGWQLAFVRKGRGRRSDPAKLREESAIAHDLMTRTWSTGKQEAAIAEVADKRKISRSKIFRAKAPRSTVSKKSTSTAKWSQKKR
jgi:hypothetical protein